MFSYAQNTDVFFLAHSVCKKLLWMLSVIFHPHGLKSAEQNHHKPVYNHKVDRNPNPNSVPKAYN